MQNQRSVDGALAGRSDTAKRDISLRAFGSRAADCWSSSANLTHRSHPFAARCQIAFVFRSFDIFAAHFRKFRCTAFPKIPQEVYIAAPGPEWDYYAASISSRPATFPL